jgi:hypothetical protein
MTWTGLRPGVAECREFGWYTKRGLGGDWMPCGKEEWGAVEDLNRPHSEAVWDRLNKRYIRPRQYETICFEWASSYLGHVFDVNVWIR